MESKGGKKFNYKIGSIVAIAVVAAIVGTLAFTSLETNSDSNTQTQSIGIGAFVTVEAYHEDGTLFQKWEGHNELRNFAQNALVGCITGLELSPTQFGSCDLNVDTITLLLHPQDGSANFLSDTITEVTLKPDGCDPVSLISQCTGWEMKGIQDFDELSCTPGVDCVEVGNLFATGGHRDPGFAKVPFNQFNLFPNNIPIIPNDRLIVTMVFDIPA